MPAILRTHQEAKAMIEVIKRQFKSGMSNEEKLNHTREFLQILCLKIVHDKGHFKQMAFIGGTALRILHNLRRFSEDLDFSVIRKKGYNFLDIISELEYELKLYGLKVQTKSRTDKTVQSCFLKFSQLLNELKLSHLKEQKLSIRIEVDSNPPKGWRTQVSLINRTYIFPILHFDLASLYATKLHACFFRRFIKGRDFYDLLWYLGKRVKPNFALLNNAIRQTEGKDLKLDEKNFKVFLLKKLKGVDFSFVKKDVERFLEDKKDLDLLNYRLIKRSLEK
jgi:predicted nucleotidyltransferase component of viral defense system